MSPADDSDLRREAARLETLSDTQGRLWREGSVNLIRFRGRTMSSPNWAKELGVSREALRKRLLNPRWTLSDALTTEGKTQGEPRLYRLDGQSHTLSQWARRAGIGVQVLSSRLKLGWSLRDALDTEVKHYPPRGSRPSRWRW